MDAIVVVVKCCIIIVDKTGLIMAGSMLIQKKEPSLESQSIIVDKTGLTMVGSMSMTRSREIFAAL